MTIHTFGEHLEFDPNLHALVADGLFVEGGLFHVMPEARLTPLEELFRARVITFLVKEGLLPPERVRMLRSWKRSRFNVHRSQRVPPGNREDMEPRTPEKRQLAAQGPIWQHPTMGVVASRFRLRANAPKGRKAISYQQSPEHTNLTTWRSMPAKR